MFADWLVKKLTAEGYLVWSERFKLLGGETYPDDVDDAIKNRTFRFLGLYSQASVNQEIMRQRSLALGIGEERNQDFSYTFKRGWCRSETVGLRYEKLKVYSISVQLG